MEPLSTVRINLASPPAHFQKGKILHRAQSKKKVKSKHCSVRTNFGSLTRVRERDKSLAALSQSTFRPAQSAPSDKYYHLVIQVPSHQA